MIEFFFQEEAILLLSGLLGLVFSVYLFLKENKYSYVGLFISATMIGFWSIQLNDYIFLWDERIHALVAKNMIANPFTPMLYKNPLISYDYEVWIRNHIWLHKPPWFLWQMALSMKLFGVNTIALRLPGLIMFLILIFFAIGIGRNLHSAKTGFIMGVLTVANFTLLTLIAGGLSTDHNDMATVFYIAGSIFFWSTYTREKKWSYVLLIGLFAGIAVLNKSLVGLLVYGLLGLSIHWKNKRDWSQFLVAFFISCLVFIPWDIYCRVNFPKEYLFEQTMRYSHIFQAVEGHRGPWWYHFNALLQQYSWTVFFGLCLPGVYLMWKDPRFDKTKKPILGVVLFTLIFYTLSATKMLLFTFILFPLIILFAALTVNRLLGLISPLRWKLLALLVIMVFSFQFENLYDKHKSKEFRDNKIAHSLWYRDTGRTVWDEKTVVQNIPEWDHTAVMFFTDCTAFEKELSDEEIKQIKQQGYRLATYEGIEKGEVRWSWVD